MKLLYKLKRVEYIEGAQAALSNAKDHLHVASLSSDMGHNGIAHSHLVIACEELCKASILRVKSLMPQMPMADLREYFVSHKIKHKKVFEIYAAICQLPADIEEKTEGYSLKNPDGSFNWALLAACALVLLTLLFDDKRNKELSLEETRIRGFYVDLSNDRKWLTPNNFFLEQDFNEHLEIVRFIFNKIETFLFEKTPCANDLNVLAKELGYLGKELAE